MRHFVPVLLVVTLGFSRTTSAQYVEPSYFQPRPSTLWYSTSHRLQLDSGSTQLRLNPSSFSSSRRTHWAEGAIVGGLLIGAFTSALSGGLCRESETAHPHCTGATVGGFVIGALVGGTIGGLIGGLFPKD